MSRPEHDRELAGQRQLAERIRQALVGAALEAHADAGIRGLCCEGQWEVAVTALRGLDLAAIVAGKGRPADPEG
jgi:hypothetical protein